MFLHSSHQGARWTIHTGLEPAGTNINEEWDVLIVVSGSETGASKSINPGQIEPPCPCFSTSFIFFWKENLYRGAGISLKFFSPLARGIAIFPLWMADTIQSVLPTVALNLLYFEAIRWNNCRLEHKRSWLQ